jgi:DNA-binding HxlR family transcriptional regulator
MLIVRDIIHFGKKTFGEFLGSEEGISSNILANRLVQLEQIGVLVKKPHDTDKRKEVYCLTDKGLDLIPILLDMACWGTKHDQETQAPQEFIDMVNSNRDKMISLIRETVQNGGSIFAGTNSSQQIGTSTVTQERRSIGLITRS